MLALTDAMEGIKDWVKACEPAGITNTVYANHGHPRPPRPFVTLKILSVMGIHQPDYRALLPDNETLPIYQDVKIMLSLEVFGDNALSLCSFIRSGMQKITTRRDLHLAGIAYIRDHGVCDLTLEPGDPRAGIDIELRSLDLILDNVGSIENVTGSGLVKESPGIGEKSIIINVEG